jgi:hypothetical protein
MVKGVETPSYMRWATGVHRRVAAVLAFLQHDGHEATLGERDQ